MVWNDIVSATWSSHKEATSGSTAAYGDARHCGNKLKKIPSRISPVAAAATARALIVDHRISMPATIIRLAPPPAISSREGPPNASHTGLPRESDGSSSAASNMDEPVSAAPNVHT